MPKKWEKLLYFPCWKDISGEGIFDLSSQNIVVITVWLAAWGHFLMSAWHVNIPEKIKYFWPRKEHTKFQNLNWTYMYYIYNFHVRSFSYLVCMRKSRDLKKNWYRDCGGFTCFRPSLPPIYFFLITLVSFYVILSCASSGFFSPGDAVTFPEGGDQKICFQT